MQQLNKNSEPFLEDPPQLQWHLPKPPPTALPAAISVGITVTSYNELISSKWPWIVDTSTTAHIVGDMFLHSPRIWIPPIHVQLGTADGCFKLISVGSVCLSKNEGQAFWLRNV